MERETERGRERAIDGEVQSGVGLETQSLRRSRVHESMQQSVAAACTIC